MEKISVTLQICTLYKGNPHGIALMKYTDPDDDKGSFSGLGIFHHGKLHNSPFIVITKYDTALVDALLLSKMQNGRPADGNISSYFRFDNDE
jgi:hypothetical protein